MSRIRIIAAAAAVAAFAVAGVAGAAAAGTSTDVHGHPVASNMFHNG